MPRLADDVLDEPVASGVRAQPLGCAAGVDVDAQAPAARACARHRRLAALPVQAELGGERLLLVEAAVAVVHLEIGADPPRVRGHAAERLAAGA